MNTERPHEIRRFSDGEAIPEKYIELTEAEFHELEGMTEDQRAAWFEKNGRLTAIEKVREAFLPPEDENHERTCLRRYPNLPNSSRLSPAKFPIPPRRDYRKQCR